jgi:hypothetical protein
MKRVPNKSGGASRRSQMGAYHKTHSQRFTPLRTPEFTQVKNDFKKTAPPSKDEAHAKEAVSFGIAPLTRMEAEF